jgi:hypothetical protein
MPKKRSLAYTGVARWYGCLLRTGVRWCRGEGAIAMTKAIMDLLAPPRKPSTLGGLCLLTTQRMTIVGPYLHLTYGLE